jgi:hypothetical protein
VPLQVATSLATWSTTPRRSPLTTSSRVRVLKATVPGSRRALSAPTPPQKKRERWCKSGGLCSDPVRSAGNLALRTLQQDIKGKPVRRWPGTSGTWAACARVRGAAITKSRRGNRGPCSTKRTGPRADKFRGRASWGPKAHTAPLRVTATSTKGVTAAPFMTG